MIQAIETRYAGCRFRSRLEARWAVFFETLGIPWEYEPQGYMVNGTPYLPDFLVYPNTEFAFWLEIKGVFPSEDELAKARGLAEGSGIPAYVYWAKLEPPAPDFALTDSTYHGSPINRYAWTNESGWRSYYAKLPPPWQLELTPTSFRFNPSGKAEKAESGFWWWTDCPHCGRALIKLNGQVGWCPSFDGRNSNSRPGAWPGKTWPVNGTYPRFAHRTQRLLAAYTAARSARFEHGESGA
ncbi:MAG: hypothetical protein JWO98_1275 [Frankiales bacterium]|nr:hypothetical protein [Frankiales bacterium]